jgi:hypothetical protein
VHIEKGSAVSINRQMLVAAVTRFDGLSLETLLTLKAGKSLIFLVGTPRPTMSVIEQQFILSLKT